MQQAGRDIGACLTVKGEGAIQLTGRRGLLPCGGRMNTRRVLRSHWAQLSHFADGKTEAQSEGLLARVPHELAAKPGRGSRGTLSSAHPPSEFP